MVFCLNRIGGIINVPRCFQKSWILTGQLQHYADYINLMQWFLNASDNITVTDKIKIQRFLFSVGGLHMNITTALEFMCSQAENILTDMKLLKHLPNLC